MSLTFKELAKNSFCDFFHLPDDYPLRIAAYADAQLKRQEAVKTRQTYAAMCSILNGAAFAIPSHGGTLVICAWAARRLFVACRKLKLIKAELSIRKIELRPFLDRDWMIPVAIALTGTAIGLGVDFGLASMAPMASISPPSVHDIFSHATSSLTDPSIGIHGAVVVHEAATNGLAAPPTGIHGLSSTHAAVQHAYSGAQDFGSGIHDQLKDVFGAHHGVLIAPDPSHSMGGAMSYLAGADVAKEIEHSLAVLIGSQSLQWMSDKLDFESIRPRVSWQLECRRLPWSTGVLCNRCESPIKYGKFYHCCDCGDDDEFNMCIGCYKDSPSCDLMSHQLRQMQLAVPGDSYHPEKSAARIRDIAGPTSLACHFCDKKITQGWYYDCWDCRQARIKCFICLPCYTRGRTCRGEDSHRLYAFPRAVFASFKSATPYQHKGQNETGRATCKKCSVFIRKGAYYHCEKCDRGTFDLCKDCYQTGEHCKRSDHVLIKYYAWKYKRPVNKFLKVTWHCSNPACTEEKTREFYFSCLETSCNKGQFGLCPACYCADLCCPVKEHDMFKCVFK